LTEAVVPEKEGGTLLSMGSEVSKGLWELAFEVCITPPTQSWTDRLN
jgi:hypothetical protein